MVKLRSRKSEEKCLPLTPTAVTTPTSANAYESLRLARIAENQARMAALGVQKHAGDLKSMFKVTKSAGGENSSPSRRKWARRSFSSTPIRRSQRLKERPPSTPFSLLLRRSGRLANHSSSSDGKNKVLFGSEDEKSSKRSKNVCRSSREDNGEQRPANAPLPPPCSPAELQLSEDMLARRCNSKTRGSIYDPILGICCHFCRQKKLCGEEGCERCGNRDGAKACIGKTDCSVCHSSTGVFCRACLRVRYGEDIEEVRQNKNWMCPHCSEEKGINPYWICNSSLCLKKRKIPPTGIAIYTAREMGYKSVAHYLVDVLKKRGFSG